MSIRRDGVLILFLLLVGIAERRIELRRALRVRHRTENLGGASRVAEFVVEVGQGSDRLFGIRLKLYRGLEFALRLLQIIVQAIQSPEEQVVVHAVGLQAKDLRILLQ